MFIVSVIVYKLQIFSWLWKWNIFENQLIFDKVVAYNKWCEFFGPSCSPVSNAFNHSPDLGRTGFPPAISSRSELSWSERCPSRPWTLSTCGTDKTLAASINIQRKTVQLYSPGSAHGGHSIVKSCSRRRGERGLLGRFVTESKKKRFARRVHTLPTNIAYWMETFWLLLT